MSLSLPTDRDALAALTGEKVTDETLFGVPVEDGETEQHVSAFQDPIEDQEISPSKEEETRSRRSSMSTISSSIASFRSQAKKAIKKSHKAVKKSTATISPSRPKPVREPSWVTAETGLSHLHEKDAEALRDVLDVVGRNYTDGKLSFRKVHVGDYHEFVEWQVKFDHAKRSCQEQSRTLKDAARKVKSYLDFKEAPETDERFKRLYEMIRGDKRYDGAFILFKEGKGKDWYPWKLRIQHDTYGWTRVSNTLSETIRAMEEHLGYEEATLGTQEGPIWERVFNELEQYPKCKVFFKEISETGPDGEPEKRWLVKVDHPLRGIQFEAKSRIFHEAAGQVYDYMTGKLKEDGENDDAKA